MADMFQGDVGVRIRAIRQRQGMSLRDLSHRSGLSINAISRIERGENSPTVSSLHRLANAFRLPIINFFSDAEENSIVFDKQHQRQRFTDSGVEMENLGNGLSDQNLQPFIMTVELESGNETNPIAHTGEEFVYCLEGRIEYRVEKRLYQLGPGDSLLFKAKQIHWCRNLALNPTIILLVFQSNQDKDLARQLHLAMKSSV